MKKIVKNRVRELMAEKGRKEGRNITQRDVEEVTGLSKNTVGKWARNETKSYDRTVIAKFLEYFSCTISDLFVYEQAGSDDEIL